MGRSAAGLRLDLDAGAVRDDVTALLAAADGHDGAVRLLVTRGGHRVALLEPVAEAPATVALATVTYAPSRLLDGVKSLSYAANALAGRIARERGADEALLVTPHGRVLEGPMRSVFYVLDGALCTPPLQDHILDSITRRRLLGLMDVRERPTPLDELRRASEAFLASTTREVLPVRAIDDVAFAAPGPCTDDAARRFAAHVAAELAAAPA